MCIYHGNYLKTLCTDIINARSWSTKLSALVMAWRVQNICPLPFPLTIQHTHTNSLVHTAASRSLNCQKPNNFFLSLCGCNHWCHVLSSHTQQLYLKDGVESVSVVFATTKRMIAANVKPASKHLCVIWHHLHVISYVGHQCYRKKHKFGGDGKSYQLCR